MKIKFLVITVTALSMLMLSAGLYAIGLGVYANGSKADYTWTYHLDNAPNPEVDSKVNKYGLGFVLDTCVARDSLFNYRMNIGYSRITIDNKDTFADMSGNEYHLYNSFGFGVFRSEPVRIWLGPQIGFGFINGDNKSSTADVSNFWTMFYTYGIVTGLNFNIEDVMTIGIDGGYRISKHAGTADLATESAGLTCTGKEFFANFSVIFRIGDVF